MIPRGRTLVGSLGFLLSDAFRVIWAFSTRVKKIFEINLRNVCNYLDAADSLCREKRVREPHPGNMPCRHDNPAARSIYVCMFIAPECNHCKRGHMGTAVDQRNSSTESTKKFQ